LFKLNESCIVDRVTHPDFLTSSRNVVRTEPITGGSLDVLTSCSTLSIHTPDAYYDLGSYRWNVTTESAEAQLWANRGLIWAYSFNHEEALRCFERAAECDPSCAMAFWGIAFSAGPNYNKAWMFFDQQDLSVSTRKANNALARAAKLAAQTTPAEQGLIHALAARFPPTDKIPNDFGHLDRAYADAMRPVYHAHSDDLDIAALFAEALMCMTPRGLWDLDTGLPTGDHTVEARKVIEQAFETPVGFNHPAHCHLYIHLLEMSPRPEVALPAADRLRGLVPDASHMLHMPTHIDSSVGDYRRGIDSNDAAIAADDKYFAVENASILYTGYRVHYVSAKLYSAMMAGRRRDALAAAGKIEQIIDAKLLSHKSPNMADWVEAHLGSKAHVMIRFGLWEDILQLEIPQDRELYCSTTAIVYYARGIAFSALGRIGEAETAQRHFEFAREQVPRTRLNSIPAREYDVLGVASAMLAGELAYRKGEFETAFSTLSEAAQREDALAYSDPPPWMQPVRHALGGLLLEQGHVGRAERVFREDLGLASGFPRRKAKLNNVWGLHGLHEALLEGGKFEEACMLKTQLDVAAACADIELSVSCYCRQSTAANGRCC
jgi:tetratricopeptide (TPR) repeat protein